MGRNDKINVTVPAPQDRKHHSHHRRRWQFSHHHRAPGSMQLKPRITVTFDGSGGFRSSECHAESWHGPVKEPATAPLQSKVNGQPSNVHLLRPRCYHQLISRHRAWGTQSRSPEPRWRVTGTSTVMFNGKLPAVTSWTDTQDGCHPGRSRRPPGRRWFTVGGINSNATATSFPCPPPT